jgi:hypothetical protein
MSKFAGNSNPFAILSESDQTQDSESVPTITPAPKIKSAKKRTGSEVSKFNKKHDAKPIPKPIPKAVLEQRALCKKYRYTYRLEKNGNIENNTTLYVNTSVAHSHQVDALFIDAIERAKKMPDVFGSDFECDFRVNVVRRHTGEYLGYAFVDVSNPKFYYALIGCNTDGTERVEYVDDPNWVPPKTVPRAPADEKPDPNRKFNWADECVDVPVSPPKIRRELPPLLVLKEYQYDDEQKSHLQTDETHGTLSVSPAFITPGVKEEYDDCSLYVSEVPAVDYDFLYEIFARYARSSYRESDNRYYPRINIHKCVKDRGSATDESKTGIFAIVEYAHHYDAAFARTMCQKIRARYNDKDINMSVRHAYHSKNR